jgi:hypothetical protein
MVQAAVIKHTLVGYVFRTPPLALQKPAELRETTDRACYRTTPFGYPAPLRISLGFKPFRSAVASPAYRKWFVG